MFEKFKGRKWSQSTHKSDYSRIAKQFGVMPEIVYLLAHGRKPVNKVEVDIIKELFNSGVLHNQ